MTKMTVDDALRAKLNGLSVALELCDQSGQTLGHFLPRDAYLRLLYARARAQITDEEIEAARQQTGGRPLREIWQRLGVS